MSMLTHYKAPPLCLDSLVYDQHSNKYTGLTIHALSLFLYPRHGGSTEPALPVATGIRLDREREEGKPGIHPCSQLHHCSGG